MVRLLETLVEVHRAGVGVERVGLDGVLNAPRFLENPFPVRAFFDRETAHALTLRNLLQRLGYEDLEAVRARGFEKGIEQGIEQGTAATLRTSIADVCTLLSIELSAEQSARLASAPLAELRELHAALVRDRRWP